jgi:hypothetical protein
MALTAATNTPIISEATQYPTIKQNKAAIPAISVRFLLVGMPV